MNTRSESRKQARLGRIIDRMQVVQGEIAADGQPPSLFQIDELTRLGHEYAELVAGMEHAEKDGETQS